MKTIPFTAAHTYIAHIWQSPPPGFQDVVIVRYFRTHAALSSKKYPAVITLGRIFIGGVVVNSSKADILDALWEITLA